MDTGFHVRVWAQLYDFADRSKMLGTIAGLLVCEGHCATETEARRYVRACFL